MMSYDAIPEYLRSLQKFVARSGKQPFVKNKKHTHLTAFEWNKHPENFLTFEEALDAVAKQEKVMTGKDKTPSYINGIGMSMYRAVNQELPLLIGGDLDCCRDPITGEMTKWASQFLLGMLPFYTEASPSKCGIRFFVMGNIDRNKLTGEGPQNEISEELKERIFAVKPGAFAKYEQGNPAFNSFELYEHGRHLSLTGDIIEEYCFPREDRTIPILRFLSKYLVEAKAKEPIVEYDSSRPASLPHLNILDVINTSGFRDTGTQLEGPHPLGSTTGKNLLVDPSKNVYCYMHNAIDKGGDGWVWLACELGLVAWEDAGKGCLKNREILAKTLQYAVSKGLISEEDSNIDLKSGILKVDLNSDIGSIGLYEKTGAIVTIVPSRTGAGKKAISKLSDCALWIDTETKCGKVTEFLFKGKGAKDGRLVEVTMSSADVESKAFREMLTNEFGGSNMIGELDWNMVQRISINKKEVRKIKIPSWDDIDPLVPGYEVDKNTIFDLPSQIPAFVYDGDIKRACTTIELLLKVHPYACILLTAILGSPAIVRWHPEDRIAIGLWGSSGNFKTTTVNKAMGVWGIKYLNGATLMAGRGSSTINGAMDVFLAAGFLPQIYDDVKIVDKKKDTEAYVSLIHKIVEGYGKVRSRKTGGLQDTDKFLCTPIITGEVKPLEASTTARVLGLDWSLSDEGKTNASKLLRKIDKIKDALPTIGYHWIKFLHETDEVLGPNFLEYQSACMQKFEDLKFTNAGRLAGLYAMIRSIWALLEVSPIGDPFLKYRDEFVKALDAAIMDHGEQVGQETEVARFLNALCSTITVEPHLIQKQGQIRPAIYGNQKPAIGRWMAHGIFVVPEAALQLIAKQGVFDQIPTVQSMNKSLKEKGALHIDTDGKHTQCLNRFNGQPVRGWYIKLEALSGLVAPKVGGGLPSEIQPTPSSTE
jgi:hypothetical protein